MAVVYASYTVDHGSMETFLEHLDQREKIVAVVPSFVNPSGSVRTYLVITRYEPD